ncbi:hypothetical protein KAI87_17185, partial [Myxococcota bacterium]|nr:hypothetical protein [Myxococcota bacterium]
MRNMYRVFQGIFQGNLTLLPLLAIGLTGIITNTGCSGNVTGGTSYDEDASVDTQGPSSASVLAEAGPDALAANVTNISTVTLNLYAEGATYYQASSDRAELKFDNAALPPLAMAGDVDTGTYCLEGETADTCNALPADTDDTYTIWVRYYDDVGNGSEIVSVTLRADNITPVLSGLTVALGDTVRSEEGKLYTRFEVLTVEPTVTMDTGLQMQLSTDDTFDSESWVGHAPTASVILPSGDCE